VGVAQEQRRKSSEGTVCCAEPRTRGKSKQRKRSGHQPPSQSASQSLYPARPDQTIVAGTLTELSRIPAKPFCKTFQGLNSCFALSHSVLIDLLNPLTPP
jgi:hypothetical protein